MKEAKHPLGEQLSLHRLPQTALPREMQSAVEQALLCLSAKEGLKDVLDRLRSLTKAEEELTTAVLNSEKESYTSIEAILSKMRTECRGIQREFSFLSSAPPLSFDLLSAFFSQLTAREKSLSAARREMRRKAEELQQMHGKAAQLSEALFLATHLLDSPPPEYPAFEHSIEAEGRLRECMQRLRTAGEDRLDTLLFSLLPDFYASMPKEVSFPDLILTENPKKKTKKLNPPIPKTLSADESAAILQAADRLSAGIRALFGRRNDDGRLLPSLLAATDHNKGDLL